MEEPMRSIFTITMILFLLTACGAAAPTATVTVTAILPTPSATATLIPTPTITPTPTEIPLPEGAISDLAKSLEGTNYKLAYSKSDPSKVVFEYKDGTQTNELTANPDGSYRYSYDFENPAGGVEHLDVAIPKEEMTITTVDGKTVISWSAWEIIDGQRVRKPVVLEDPKTGEIRVVDRKMYSKVEAAYIMLRETEKVREKFGLSQEDPLPEQYEEFGIKQMKSLLNLGQRGSYKGRYIPYVAGDGDLDVKMWTPPPPWEIPAYGTESIVTCSSTGEAIRVLVFAFTSVNSDGETGFIKYKDVEGNEKAIFVDYAELSIIRRNKVTGELNGKPVLSIP
jgi:hypothetical protein